MSAKCSLDFDKTELGPVCWPAVILIDLSQHNVVLTGCYNANMKEPQVYNLRNLPKDQEWDFIELIKESTISKGKLFVSLSIY